MTCHQIRLAGRDSGVGELADHSVSRARGLLNKGGCHEGRQSDSCGILANRRTSVNIVRASDPIARVVVSCSVPSFSGREYHEGSVLANRLGLQIVRALVMNREIRTARRALPTTSQSPEADVIHRDGVLVIPSFLPADVFAAVKEEYDSACHAGLLEAPECVEDNGVIERRIRVGRNRERFAVTRRALGDSHRLRTLAAAVTGRLPDKVSLIVSIMSSATGPTAPSRLIGSNYIHADIHFPSVKAWLYLNDVDESNAAMTYARCSHRLSLGRLAYEYEASVRVARAKQRTAVGQTVAYGLVRVPTEAQLARMAIREEPLCGPANTLVIADTMGFHRRGEFQGNRTRDLLNIRFNDRGGTATPR